MATETSNRPYAARLVLNLIAAYLPQKMYAGRSNHWYQALFSLTQEHEQLFDDFGWSRKYGNSWCSGVDTWLTRLHGAGTWVLHIDNQKWFQFPEPLQEELRDRLANRVSVETLKEIEDVALKLSTMIPTAARLVREIDA